VRKNAAIARASDTTMFAVAESPAFLKLRYASHSVIMVPMMTEKNAINPMIPVSAQPRVTAT